MQFLALRAAKHAIYSGCNCKTEVLQLPHKRDILDQALLLNDFSFKYRAQTEPTLIGINLKVNRGEKILILGPSGSGKSTLIHCINGIIPHSLKGESSGIFSLMGSDIRGLNIFDISKIAGTVLQDTDGQFVGLSAAEDIAFALENDCVAMEEMNRRVTEASLLVNMAAHLGKSPQDLSGGQKQRVAIARALVKKPALILADEPTANLDSTIGREILELMLALNKSEGTTFIFSTHDQMVMDYARRLVRIRDGRIESDEVR